MCHENLLHGRFIFQYIHHFCNNFKTIRNFETLVDNYYVYGRNLKKLPGNFLKLEISY